MSIVRLPNSSHITFRSLAAKKAGTLVNETEVTLSWSLI